MTKPAVEPERLDGVWSAAPTPFTDDMRIDRAAVTRMVEHHIRLGVRGLFLCGTCGEGPWMTDSQRRELVATVTEAAAGRLVVAAQVTDNSAARILDNMAIMQDAGADIAVIAPPYYLINANADTLSALYLDAVRNSPVPVGIYDRGKHGAVVVPKDTLEQVYAETAVVLVKDSSLDAEHRELALRMREQRPNLRLLNGYEFDCVSYLEAGYDGLLLGGGVFNGYIARLIVAAVRAGNAEEAKRLQKRMNRLMWDAYGGETITSWLTGLKELLVRMKIFGTNRSYLNFPLTEACSEAIQTALTRDADVLLP